ncbi:hypothetical protein CWATWH8502_2260 [Crocosphaera watsonii WH 8502]|uniref:Uncharacterized protein n=1 Tax=Crocosphaera watsonii WH 8502 TaxID=423474 RepID=T2IBD7_CROWT|nr:hypothetical protein CWATWH8502_2260 [Crocosphaera watsonii WH 8502]
MKKLQHSLNISPKITFAQEQLFVGVKGYLCATTRLKVGV